LRQPKQGAPHEDLRLCWRPQPKEAAGLSCRKIFQNTHPFMAGRIKQSPDAAETARSQLAVNLRVLDQKLSGQLVAGAHPTIADCTLFAALEFAEFAQIAIDPSCANVARWQAMFKKRPSARM
jgi:glutathione S-transferase